MGSNRLEEINIQAIHMKKCSVQSINALFTDHSINKDKLTTK